MSPWFVFICTKDSARKHAIISASCQSVKLSPLELNWILEMLNSFWPFWLITKVWCALHTCLYTTGFKKGCWKKKGRKCTRQSQKVIWASSNQWISTSQIKNKQLSNLWSLFMQWYFLRFPCKSCGQGTMTWKLPTIPLGFVSCTFPLFLTTFLKQLFTKKKMYSKYFNKKRMIILGLKKREIVAVVHQVRFI